MYSSNSCKINIAMGLIALFMRQSNAVGPLWLAELSSGVRAGLRRKRCDQTKHSRPVDKDLVSPRPQDILPRIFNTSAHRRHFISLLYDRVLDNTEAKPHFIRRTTGQRNDRTAFANQHLVTYSPAGGLAHHVIANQTQGRLPKPREAHQRMGASTSDNQALLFLEKFFVVLQYKQMFAAGYSVNEHPQAALIKVVSNIPTSILCRKVCTLLSAVLCAGIPPPSQQVTNAQQLYVIFCASLVGQHVLTASKLQAAFPDDQDAGDAFRGCSTSNVANIYNAVTHFEPEVDRSGQGRRRRGVKLPTRGANEITYRTHSKRLMEFPGHSESRCYAHKGEAVHDKVSSFEFELRKKSLPLRAYISTGALSDMRPVKLVTMDRNERDGRTRAHAYPLPHTEISAGAQRNELLGHWNHPRNANIVIKHQREPVGTLASHQGKQGSIPGRVTGFSQVGIVPDDADGRRVLSGISRFPPPPIPMPLHFHFNHLHRLLRPRCYEPPKSLHSLFLIGSLVKLSLYEAEEYPASRTLAGLQKRLK
ncbi:hypothetical protein PR048_029515 [Dryococelus australis]|uniref:Uncharacterized protein n=1 Tax=Dryococelus australis TaxID=614101 RepID=A0ABQ9GFW3_9NEOP|nr:hypothetical protein PR048_029515 [Dryococelus australis]